MKNKHNIVVGFKISILRRKQYVCQRNIKINLLKNSLKREEEEEEEEGTL